MNLAPHWAHTCGLVSSNEEFRRFLGFGDVFIRNEGSRGEAEMSDEGLPLPVLGLREGAGPKVLTEGGFELEVCVMTCQVELLVVAWVRTS